MSDKKNLERIRKKLYQELHILEKDYIPTCDIEELDQSELELKIDQLVDMINALNKIIPIKNKAQENKIIENNYHHKFLK